MRKKQMKTINIFLFIGFLFFIIGIIFFAAGSAILISGNSFMKNAEKTTAEISEIDSYYSGSSMTAVRTLSLATLPCTVQPLVKRSSTA